VFDEEKEFRIKRQELYKQFLDSKPNGKSKRNHRARQPYRQGIYKPINPHKYINNKPIEYRSQLEFDYMHKIDKSDNVISWGSETVVIEYFNPVKQSMARYFTDLCLETKSHGRLIVEIKPEKEKVAINESKEPKRSKRKKESTYRYELGMYKINESKWKAAKRYCQDRGWEFMVVTEKDLKNGTIPFI